MFGPGEDSCHSPNLQFSYYTDTSILSDSYSGGYYRSSIQQVALPEVPRIDPPPTLGASTAAASLKSLR